MFEFKIDEMGRLTSISPLTSYESANKEITRKFYKEFHERIEFILEEKFDEKDNWNRQKIRDIRRWLREAWDYFECYAEHLEDEEKLKID